VRDESSDRPLQRHSLVRLRRRVQSLPPYVGIVLDVSDELVLLRDVDDERIGGFTVLSRESVGRVRANWMQRHQEARVRPLVDSAEVDAPFPVDLRSMSALFRSLQAAGVDVVAEREHPRRFAFMTGRIVHVNGRTVGIQWPRELDRPAQQTERTPFTDITRVAFA